MGALTLKSFPFELRGWDIEKFESLDPTDGFGSNTRVYINKGRIVQIEPDYSIHSFNAWISDKGRHFFDGIFKTWSENEEKSLDQNLRFDVLTQITKIVYIFDHCNKQNNKTYFFTLILKNLSIEMLNMLLLISHTYSFIKLKRPEVTNANLDLETNFQLNNASKATELNNSNLVMLISTNPRYEGYQLNLKLRQRSLKGDFRCLVIGSLIDLTFPISFLGSSTKILKSIVEGNHYICQDLKFANNPILIYNSELVQHSNGKSLTKAIKLCSYNIFNKTWNGLNVLNPELDTTGNFALAKLSKLTLRDFEDFSSLYFLNIKINSNISNFKKLTELKLLKHYPSYKKKFLKNKVLFDQNSKINNNEFFSKKLLTSYERISSSNFYENEETFINTEGLIKWTTWVLSRNKNSWQTFRKFLKQIKTKITFLEEQNNKVVVFNSKNFYNFRNFICFNYHASQSLTNLSFYLNTRNKAIVLNNSFSNIKTSSKKLFNTKFKLWLDDFYIGGKDEFSHNSIMLTNCSKILRTESTNFF